MFKSSIIFLFLFWLFRPWVVINLVSLACSNNFILLKFSHFFLLASNNCFLCCDWYILCTHGFHHLALPNCLTQVILAPDYLAFSHFRLCAIRIYGLCHIGYAKWKLPLGFPFSGYHPTCSCLCSKSYQTWIVYWLYFFKFSIYQGWSSGLLFIIYKWYTLDSLALITTYESSQLTWNFPTPISAIFS